MNKILCLGGDGIGPEIMEEALKVLQAVAPKYNFQYEIEREAFGGAAIDLYGSPFPDALKRKSEQVDAILLGAIGGERWENSKLRPEEGLLALRKYLKVFANVRSINVNPSLTHLSPLKKNIVEGTDITIVRELTGGAYFGKPRELKEDFARDSIVYTREEIERIVRYAFFIANKKDKKLTSVDKANVLASSKLWRRIVKEVAKEFPQVQVNHMYVDAMAMALITNPKEYTVIVTENLFGDILSDEVSVLAGSLGLLPSASFSLEGPALYEPAHGSAPDLAGRDIANPIAMIKSMTMMLRYSFDEKEMADEIDQAIERTLEKGYLTKDLSGDKFLGLREWIGLLLEEVKKK